MNTKKEEREDTKKKKKKKYAQDPLEAPDGRASGRGDGHAQVLGVDALNDRADHVGGVACDAVQQGLHPACGSDSSKHGNGGQGIGNRESEIGGCWRWWDWDGTSRCAMGDVPILSCVCAIESYGWKCPIKPLWVCLSGSCLALSKKTW